MLAWLQANWGVVFAALFALDQVLAMIPSIESNSTFQLISNVIKSLGPKPPAA